MMPHYRVKIKNQDFEIEIESSDKAFVEKKLKDYSMISFEKNHSASSVEKTSSRSQDKKVSLNEFYKSINPKGGSQHVLLVSYYKETYEGLTEIATQDIANGFKEIRYRSTNIARDVAQAKTARFIMPGSSKRSFVVTNSGQEWIRSRSNS